MASYNDSRTPFLAQALAALLASVSPLLESLNLCPIGQEPSKLSRLNAQVDGIQLPETDYFFKHFLDRVNSGPPETMPFLQNLRRVRFLVDADEHIWEWYYYQPYGLYGSLNLVRRLPGVESIRLDGNFEAEDFSVLTQFISVGGPRSSKRMISLSMIDRHYVLFVGLQN